MLDTKEEQKYERLRKLGQELHIPIPEAFWTLEVFDKDGKLLQIHKQRSHSWVRNAYNTLLSQMANKGMDALAGEYGAGYLSTKCTDGVVYRGASYFAACVCSRDSWEAAGHGFRGNAGEDIAGIVAGSGVNAESFEDHILQTQITEGVGGGQLNHAAMVAPTKGYAALTWTITWLRYLNNNSGGDVSVNEVGLYTDGMLAGQAKKFMVSRDKLASTVTVPDTGQLKVTYTFTLTYPA